MTFSQDPESDYSAIESLSSVLTPQQVFNFLEKSVPELKKGQGSLEQSLANRRWEAAAKQAHRLKSTISLLTAESLVESLDLIESGTDPMIQSPDFRESIVAQCQQLIDNLESYLTSS